MPSWFLLFSLKIEMLLILYFVGVNLKASGKCKFGKFCGHESFGIDLVYL